MSTARVRNKWLRGKSLQRGAAWGMIILGALLAFEIFNFSTTDFALRDLLGDLRFMGIRWATILSIAFCGIDFAGIARIFTPEQGRDEPMEVWYLFGAWLLAAAMNASLTWWGVSIAILSHNSMGSAIVSSKVLTKAIPIFVAVMVWLIRVLIIGTFSLAGDRLFTQTDAPAPRPRATASRSSRPAARPARPAPRTATYRASTPKPFRQDTSVSEPTYHPLVDARPAQPGVERFGQREL
jgi:hypothetical protein